MSSTDLWPPANRGKCRPPKTPTGKAKRCPEPVGQHGRMTHTSSSTSRGGWEGMEGVRSLSLNSENLRLHVTA